MEYDFVTDEQFDALVADGGLLEWAVVHNSHRYGTPRHLVEEAVAAGRTVVLEIDMQGARQVRESYPQAEHIFLAPPSGTATIAALPPTAGRIERATLLGGGAIPFRQGDGGLTLQMPPTTGIAPVVRLEGQGLA